MPYLIGSFEQPIGNYGFPDFTYSGAHTIVDTGETSGQWQIALTGTGVLTLNAKAKMTIKAQGGGGAGGASNGSQSGSDGADGSIVELESQSLDAGTYSISIGARGSIDYDSSGFSGGATKFGDLLTANGGRGGAYAGGNRNQTHTSIYGNYGKGGLGGSTGQYSGDTTYKWVFKATSQCYMYTEPSSITGWNEGSLSAGQTVYLSSNTTYASTDGSGGSWYKTESGLYVNSSKGSASYTKISDTRSWYGNYGYAGVILLSGKA